jgi:membrane protease YdiL (CAAX protease family)
MKKLHIINLLEITALLVIPMFSSRLSFIYILLVLGIVLISKRERKERWADYGFKAVEGSKVLWAAAIGLSYAAFSNYVQEPLVAKLTGESPDISNFDSVTGNLWAFLGLLAIGWVIGGLFEEFLFRGYLFNRIGQVFSDTVWGKCAAIVLTSISFSIAHTYQGIGGIINTFIFSVILGLVFYLFKRNTWYVILVHGFFDTYGILWIYMGW